MLDISDKLDCTGSVRGASDRSVDGVAGVARAVGLEALSEVKVSTDMLIASRPSSHSPLVSLRDWIKACSAVGQAPATARRCPIALVRAISLDPKLKFDYIQPYLDFPISAWSTCLHYTLPLERGICEHGRRWLFKKFLIQ